MIWQEKGEIRPDLALLAEAVPYLVKGRPWDLVHTVYSAKELAEIIGFAAVEGLIDKNRIKEVKRLATAAVILHDIGNSQIPDAGENWSKPENRIGHMLKGARLARELLERLGGYTQDEKEMIGLLVGTHDALYLRGKDISGIEDASKWSGWDQKVTSDLWLPQLALVVREADQVWPMHHDSFWKDVHSKVEEKHDYENAQQVLDRGVKRYKLATSYGRKLVQQQIWDRQKEISGTVSYDTYDQLLAKWAGANEQAAADPAGWVAHNLLP